MSSGKETKWTGKSEEDKMQLGSIQWNVWGSYTIPSKSQQKKNYFYYFTQQNRAAQANTFSWYFFA